jgi:molecular chaperone DnaJ
MTIGFEDAIHGVKTRIRATAWLPAARAGDGAMSPGKEVELRRLRRHRAKVVQRGFMKFSGTCPACGGRGQAPGEECPACRGAGAVQVSDLIAVRIPPGVDSGSKVRVPAGATPAGAAAPRAICSSPSRSRRTPSSSAKARTSRSRCPSRSPKPRWGPRSRSPPCGGGRPSGSRPGPSPGRNSGSRGRAPPSPARRTKGDEFVEVFIVPPPFEDQRVRELMKELERSRPRGPGRAWG